MTPKLTVVMNEFNEELNISRALESIKKIADEIILVDLESTDNTKAIAKKFDAKIYSHKNPGYVEPTRNFGISKASGKWVLVIDADEEISPSLSAKIIDVINNPDADYYLLPRKNLVFGKWLKHSRWWPDYNIRLFKKGHVSWGNDIHSVPEAQGRGAEFKPDGQFAIIHHHYNSVDQYIERMLRYTTHQANLKIADGYKFNWPDIINKPFSEFLSRYFFGQGYKDGIHGLALSILQGFSEFVLYLKVWQSEKSPDIDISLNGVVNEIQKVERDLHYWQNDALFNETGNIMARVKRKLRI
jgi:(heptosyl)LPS beta-1,4-glucosyltransferase